MIDKTDCVVRCKVRSGCLVVHRLLTVVRVRDGKLHDIVLAAIETEPTKSEMDGRCQQRTIVVTEGNVSWFLVYSRIGWRRIVSAAATPQLS